MSTVDRQALFSGTEMPPEHLKLDVRALERYFAGRLEGLGTEFTVEKFKGGQSNPTYRLSGAQSYVLRRRPPGPLLPSAHAIDREYRVMTALARAGFPVPRPYLYCEDESVIGSAFYVVSLSQGRVFWNAELAGMQSAERAAIYDDMNARLAELHALDVEALGLGDFGAAGGYVSRNLARWSKVYRQSELVPIPDMDWLIDRLPAMVPEEARSCLVHGDYGLYNVVIAPDAPRIEAILDWEMATLGDPFVDLAHHVRPWWEPPNTGGAATSLRERDLAALGIPSMEAYIEAYCGRIGVPELPHRSFYLGFAQFRYAAMIQGILKRAALGTATSRAVLHRQERVFEVAALARRSLDGGISNRGTLPMHTRPSPRALALREQLSAFMAAEVHPNEALYERQLLVRPAPPFEVPALIDELKAKAKAQGLWNLFLPNSEHGAGLTNLEYAPLAEIMGRVHWAAEIFNCSAPDTGNIEVLDRYGSSEQKRRYLSPLLDGHIRSCYCMTEPGVASSDATNIETRIERDGDDYLINGRKWWITNAYHPNTGVFIVMGKTDSTAPRHLQQSQILVEPGTPGITLVRPLSVFGYLDAPKGHAEIVFDNVRVPAENLILGEGRGFEISQGRLGPGRIHHCMRIIGHSERLLELACLRLVSRVAFGKALADQSVWQERIAEARTEINMCRLLTQHAAWLMDTVGNGHARSEISQIKVAATRMGLAVANLAIQAHGAAGLCDDEGLGFAYARMRMISFGDGPDEVHNRVIAREELRKYRDPR